MKNSFNLLEDPWIPVLNTDKEYKLKSIKDVLYNPTEYIEITSKSPCIVATIKRLLLAILHRNFGPENKRVWKKIWNEGKWDISVLEEYFNKWHDSFYLINLDKKEGERFYQILPQDAAKKNRTTPLTKLSLAFSSGNNSALFDHHWDCEPQSFSAAEAAQLLLSFQGYAVGGGVSKPYNYSHAPLITGILLMVKGKNLFESLMLNLTSYNSQDPFPMIEQERDIPFWEREEKRLSEDKNGRMPVGYLDYLTWQSRRVWLLYDEEKSKNSKSIIFSEMYMAQGEKVHSDFIKDPMMIYIKKMKEFKAIRMKNNSSIWRETESLIRIENTENFPSKILLFLSNLLYDEIIDVENLYNIVVYGICNDPSKAAKILNWGQISIPVPLIYLKEQERVNDLQKFMDKLDEMRKVLNDMVFSYIKSYLFPNSESLSKNQLNQVSTQKDNLQIEIKYWQAVKNVYFNFIVEIAEKQGLSERNKYILKILSTDIKNILDNIISEIHKQSLHNPRALKAFVKKKGLYYNKIKNVLENI